MIFQNKFSMFHLGVSNTFHRIQVQTLRTLQAIIVCNKNWWTVGQWILCECIFCSTWFSISILLFLSWASISWKRSNGMLLLKSVEDIFIQRLVLGWLVLSSGWVGSHQQSGLHSWPLQSLLVCLWLLGLLIRPEFTMSFCLVLG